MLSQVVNALRGEDIVVVSPREGLSDQTSGLQGSHQAEDLQVVDREGLGVDGLVEVLLGNKSSLCKHQNKQQDEELVHLFIVKHHLCMSAKPMTMPAFTYP